MQLTQFNERQKLIQWAERIKAVAEKRNDNVSAGAIQREIEELKSGKFMLAVLGKVKRGKSTFCNAFLGRQNDLVAPVDKLPASSVISKIIWGAEEQVRVIYRNGNTELVNDNHSSPLTTIKIPHSASLGTSV